MANLRIYDNPKGKWFRAGQYPPLSVTGSLPDHTPGAAYSERLSINNAIGDCSVELLSSTNWPHGASLTVDQATDEVIVAWPAYAVLSVEDSILNPGFEDGDVEWVKGAGWQIDAQQPNQCFDGTHSAEYTTGFRGNSRLISLQRRTCAPATVVTASCQIQQGASSEGNAGGWCMVFFYDEDGVLLRATKGNKVDEGSNSEWHESTVTDTAPAGTAFAAIGAEAFRKKQSRSLWFDAFEWDLEPAVDEYVGTNSDDVISLCLRVTDSAGRKADWCGTIEAVPPSYDDLVLAANPVAWWKLDEASGVTVVDYVAGNNGTCFGTYTRGYAPIRNGSTGCIRFTALYAGVGVATAPEISLAQGSPFSVEAWGLLESGTAMVLFRNSNNPALGYVNAELNVRGLKPGGSFTGIDNNIYAKQSPDVISLGTPVHLVWTYDGAGVEQIIVNGVLKASGPTNNIAAKTTASGWLYIGADGNPAYAASYGALSQMSDVIVYAAVVTVAEALARYNAGVLP